MRSAPRIGSQDGFTLVELIVAMVLVAGLLAVVSSVLMKTFAESGRSRQERKVVEDVRKTFDTFANDIRKAKTPDRDPQYVGNAGELSEALLQPEDHTKRLSIILPGQSSPTTLDVRDVVEATATSFAFRTDAVPGGGVECVRYWVNPERAFVRSVLNYVPASRACDGTNPISQEVLVKEVQ